ncbi:MAG: glucosyl-3-phosphoglycerate synthase [Chloroflexota bacterium]|nr:glucosyl-3-phosphoglycerate synthase [Chloroflexota bacterium]
MSDAQQLMLVLTETGQAETLLRLALGLAGDKDTLHLRALVTVAEDTSPSEYVTNAQYWRNLLLPFAQADARIADDVRVFVDHQPIQALLQAQETGTVDLMLIQWAGPHERTGGFATEQLLAHFSSDVVLLAGKDWATHGRVLLSLRGGPNLTLGTRVAKALSNNASITLFHAADKAVDVPELEIVMRADPMITRAVTAVTSIAEGIIRESNGHRAIVMGAGMRQPDASSISPSSVVERVFDMTDLPIALVRTRTPEALTFHAPHEATAAKPPVSTRVDRWFAENTFDSREFADIATLVALKEKRGVTISLGLPALNEEKTVENVIRTLKGALMDEFPLLDEIVLIDSNSTDNTVALAQGCGIPTYRHPEVLNAEVGTYRGKGEALWKSLHVLKGDIIAWVDTDITNIHPRFVYGLLGPLLKYPHLQFVKGFYQRPIQVGDKLQAYGGGRVTELVARPMFNLFYPELSGFVQPLSGEYAGRRAALEQIPFFTGYGVETGMLIDLIDRFGLDALAQVDLEVRVHHNQTLTGLSRMSFAILQVFISRLESRYGVQLLDAANRSMKLIVHDAERFALDIEAIGDVERPPMATLTTYREQQSQ